MTNTAKDLLTLLSRLELSNVRVRENGEFLLQILEKFDHSSCPVVTKTVIFSLEGEDTGKGSYTLVELLENDRRAKALAKLTPEDREVLGLSSLA